MASITINKNFFYHNLNQIALQTGSIEKIAIVLKDNAYGHGLSLMAELASSFGIKHAIVRKTHEALEIETLFDTVLVLGDKAIKHPCYSYALNSLADIAHAQKGAKVELKVDTGMHRNGIAITELDEALEAITKQGLELVGLMTHYRSADVLSSEFFWQQKQFESLQKQVKEAGFSTIRIHSHNSASILRSKSFDEDLVRVGIGAYGYNELPSIFDSIALKPILSLYATKIASREIKEGQRVGYGGNFVATRVMHISTYDLGYGDGWYRHHTDTPFMTAEALPILGRVSMDFISIESNKEQICIMNDAQKVAKQWDTISYEVTTTLHKEIERKIV